MNWKAISEAIKEPLRLLVLAVIPFAVTYFTELGYQWAIVAVLVLRFVDKVLHEIGKAESTKSKENLLVKGLTRF